MLFVQVRSFKGFFLRLCCRGDFSFFQTQISRLVFVVSFFTARSMEVEGRRKHCSSIRFSLGSSETTTGYGFDSSGHENGGSILEWAWCSHISSLDEVSMANEEGQGLTKKMNVEMGNNGEGAGSKNGKKCFAGLSRRQWTEEEDRKLIALVKQCGERKWTKIAEELASRAPKQCRERWHNHLRPDIKRGRWSEEEEKILVETHEKFGNRWAKIAKFIPGRSENAIKNHWNSAKRRQRREKEPESSVLEDYFQSKDEARTVFAGVSNPSPSSFQTTISTFFFPRGRSPPPAIVPRFFTSSDGDQASSNGEKREMDLTETINSHPFATDGYA